MDTLSFDFFKGQVMFQPFISETNLLSKAKATDIALICNSQPDYHDVTDKSHPHLDPGLISFYHWLYLHHKKEILYRINYLKHKGFPFVRIYYSDMDNFINSGCVFTV